MSMLPFSVTLMLTVRPHLETQQSVRLQVLAIHLLQILLILQILGFPAVDITSSALLWLLLRPSLPLFTTDPQLKDVVNEVDLNDNDTLDIL